MAEEPWSGEWHTFGLRIRRNLVSLPAISRGTSTGADSAMNNISSFLFLLGEQLRKEGGE